MNPSTPLPLPSWLLEAFGLPYCQFILDLYDHDGPRRAVAFHGPGLDARNYIRENTHGWTDQEIDNGFIPILRRAAQLARPAPCPR